MSLRASWISIVCLLLAGCVQLADQGAQSVLIKAPDEKTRQFILLGAGNYEGDLTFALAEQGLQVKPIAVTQAVTELESDTRIVSYKKAGFRYALKLSVIDDYA